MPTQENDSPKPDEGATCPCEPLSKGLHTRGHKPKYWERGGFDDARAEWSRHWRFQRTVGQRSAVLWERLAAAAYRASRAPDPLVIAHYERLSEQARKRPTVPPLTDEERSRFLAKYGRAS